ncbi:MAG: toxin-antitoxin system HicB family antitoxin [Gammaproteobacteria bacterium]|nr:toxin-antitoxin system HicB family antitoxin [Gammaproteobacteria bacterium]
MTPINQDWNYAMAQGKQNNPEDKKLLIRLPKELHQKLRLLAFELNVSMAELCREGLELILQKHQKRK